MVVTSVTCIGPKGPSPSLYPHRSKHQKQAHFRATYIYRIKQRPKCSKLVINICQGSTATLGRWRWANQKLLDCLLPHYTLRQIS